MFKFPSGNTKKTCYFIVYLEECVKVAMFTKIYKNSDSLIKKSL